MKKYLTLLAFALIGGAVAAPGNLVKNGSFENGLENWSLWWADGDEKAAHKGTTDKVRLDGRASLEADMPAAPSRWCISQKFDARPGTDYQFSFNFFTPNDAPGKGMARLSFYDATGKHQGYVAWRELPPTANVWCDYHTVVTTPANVVAIEVELNMFGPGRSYFDNVSVKALGKGGERWNKLYPDNTPIVLKSEGKVAPEANIFPYWSYTNSADRCFKLANALGIPYSLEGEITEAAHYGLAPFYNMWHSGAPELAKKHRLAVTFYPLSPVAFELSQAKPAGDYVGGILHANDPELARRTMAQIEAADFKNAAPEVPVIFFMRDELYGNSLRFPDNYPNVTSDYWKDMDGIVRRDYGFGKFGLPKGAQDTDPFARIAFARYQNDLSLKHLREQRDAFKKRFPQGLIIGCDEWSAVTALDWEKLAELIDIQPGQTLHTQSGSASFATAHLTQFYRDMTGKPVYPFLQIGKYPVAPSTEQLQEIITQAVRSGASGFFVGDVEWYDRGNESPRFAAPENWQTYLDGVELVRNLGVVPKPDAHKMMLHFSSFTQMTLGLDPSPAYPAAYALLGPRCRSQFTYVDDYRIDRHGNILDGYSVLVVPQAKYTTKNIFDRFEKAVKGGATLVVFDPEAFSFTIDGESLAARREALLGVATRDTYPMTNILIGKKRFENPAGEIFTIELKDNAEVIAVDAAGKPAIVEHTYGKGKVWYFAFRLLDNFAVEDFDWIAQLRQWLPVWGAPVDCDFWRWKLEFPKHAPSLEKSMQCVSGNGLFMERNAPLMDMNAKGACTYCYGTSPQAWCDAAPGPDGMIAGGKLLNRTDYAKVTKDASGNFTKPEEMEPQQWAVRFGKAEAGANFVSFDFGRPVKVDVVRVFFGGTLPEMTLKASADGKKFVDAGKIAANEAPEQAIGKAELTLELKPRVYRYWQLVWNKSAGTELTLSEIDFWRK